MISAEELLKPISEPNPCGEDLSYDPSFQELETLMRGKPETQFSEAEEPDWKKLHERCLELFTRSKDLRLATALCLTAVKLDGLPALPEGLALLKGLLETYWDPVYPRLDPEDNNDPLQRVNILAALATPKGTFGDPMRFLERLQEVPLSSSAQMGRFSLADVVRSQSGEAAAAGKQAASREQIDAAFRDTNPEHLQSVHQLASDSISLVKAIDDFLTRTIGTDKAPDLDLLKGGVEEIQKCLAPYLPAGMAAVPDTADGDLAAPGATPAGKPLSGEIQSRQDVVRMLEKICQYYGRTEPSSPIPYLLKRAQRLVEMDFMQIITDLSPDALNQVRLVTGEKPEA